MYDDLIKAIRETDFGDKCVMCEHSDMCMDKDCIILQAADIIEEQQRDLDAANEAAVALYGALEDKKSPVIVLDEGPLSSKIVAAGTIGEKQTFGMLRICKYKDDELREYGEVTPEDIGEPLVTILFGKLSGIRKMADLLYKLHDKMVVE